MEKRYVNYNANKYLLQPFCKGYDRYELRPAQSQLSVYRVSKLVCRIEPGEQGDVDARVL